MEFVARLEVDSLPPLGIVDCFNKWRGSNHAPTKVTAVETLHSLTSSTNRIELDENFGRVRVGIDMDDVAKLSVALSFDISK